MIFLHIFSSIFTANLLCMDIIPKWKSCFNAKKENSPPLKAVSLHFIMPPTRVLLIILRDNFLPQILFSCSCEGDNHLSVIRVATMIKRHSPHLDSHYKLVAYYHYYNFLICSNKCQSRWGARPCIKVRILPFHPSTSKMRITLRSLGEPAPLSENSVSARTSRITPDGRYPLPLPRLPLAWCSDFPPLRKKEQLSGITIIL